MASDRIEKLLEEYFEARTTTAQEQELRAYFNQEEIAPQLEQYRPLFQYLNAAKKERYMGEVTIRRRRYSYRWIGVAAVAILAFGIYFGKSYQEQREAEYAYQETRKALALLAVNLDKGNKKVAYINEFEKTKQKIYKHN